MDQAVTAVTSKSCLIPVQSNCSTTQSGFHLRDVCFTLYQILQKPGQQDLKLMMRDLSKNVAQSVSELVKSCEALKGKISPGFVFSGTLKPPT